MSPRQVLNFKKVTENFQIIIWPLKIWLSILKHLIWFTSPQTFDLWPPKSESLSGRLYQNCSCDFMTPQLPFVAAQQFSVKLLVTFWSFDRIHQFLGFDEVVVVPLQVVGLGHVAGHRGRIPVDALRPVLLQVCVGWGCRG